MKKLILKSVQTKNDFNMEIGSDQWKRVKSKFYSFLLDHTNSEQMLLDFILISIFSYLKQEKNFHED